MRHVAISALCVLVLACSKEEPQQAGVRVEVNYTPSFKTGCFVVRTLDAANVELGSDNITDLSKGPPLKVAVLRKAGWPEKVQFIVTAYEQTCGVQQVDDESVELDLSGVGFQEDKTQRLALETPDADGDGYVPTANGGTDCNDGSREARPNGPAETCDGLDNDCQGGIDNGLPRTEFYKDGDGDGVGAGPVVLACTAPTGHVTRQGDCDDANANASPDKAEACNDFDDDCDGQRNEGFSTSWYRDGDGDSYGDQSQMVESCNSQVAGYVQVSGNSFDCKDDDANVNPGATEKCNGADDNCASGADETFMTGSQALGASCLNDTCGGVFVCDSNDNTRTACNAPAPTLYYADVDSDMQGASGSIATRVCPGATPPANRVANAQDCDDADPGTKVMGTEVCDGLDNNCDGQLDEGLTCGGALRQVFNGALGGGGHLWRTVAVDPTDGYPVWVAGMGGKLAVRHAPNAEFVSHSFGDDPANSTNCGDFDWYAAWVRPSDGHVFLTGQGGRVAQHTGTACINSVDPGGSDNAKGIVGFESGGVTTLYYVDEGGRLFRWVPPSAPVEQQNTSNIYKDIHAVDPSLLLVAGATSGGNQFITSYVGGVLNANTAHALSNSISGSINSLWMGASNRAIAVGDGGAVWGWNGLTNWSLVTPPPGATPNFSSVVMPPGSNVAYMVDSGSPGPPIVPGKLWRRTAFGWARAPRITPAGATEPVDPDVPLYDIAMTSVGDFWMVGENGRVYHYPQP